MKAKVYQTALGIETDDIVTTSYGSGPYVVVRIVECQDGSISLVCKSTRMKTNMDFYLNGISLVDGRYLTKINDEIFVQKPERREPVQKRLF